MVYCALIARSAGRQNRIHQLADGAVAAVFVDDERRLLRTARHGVGGSRGEAGNLHRLQVVHVVAHEADFARARGRGAPAKDRSARALSLQFFSTSVMPIFDGEPIDERAVFARDQRDDQTRLHAPARRP